jgi:hypothetical protein
MTDNDLSFYDTTKVFTYKKLPVDLMPCTIETVMDLNPYKPTCDKFSHYAIPFNRLSDEFLTLMDECEMAVANAEIFYRPGNSRDMSAFIHTDGHKVIPGFAKINYVMGEPGNIMRWYRPKLVSERNEMTTSIGTKYLYFGIDECTVIDKVDMSGLYVVNAGIPHSVEISAGSVTNPRICISITPKPTKGTVSNLGCHDTFTRLNSVFSARTG